MRIDHGLKLEGDKLIITLPLKDGKKPSEVVVNGMIYSPEKKHNFMKKMQQKIQLLRGDSSITCVKPEKMHDRTMGDLISRQDAIDAVDSETVSTNPEHFKSSEKFIEFMDDVDIASFGKWKWANGFNTALVATRVQLKKLPSAEQERKVGKWTEDNACEFCGFQPWYEHDIHTLSFCPNCGADMRGE